MQESTQLHVTDVLKAVYRARATIEASDRCVSDMARLIAGRLQQGNVSDGILRQLKKELANYNINTNSWKAE